MPVLPEVGSTILPPGLSLPLFSASSTIASAIRSLIDAPGLTRSCLIQTSAPPSNRRLTRTCGVLPIVSRMLAAFILALLSRGQRLNGLSGRCCKMKSHPAGDDIGILRGGIGQVERPRLAQLGEDERPGQGHADRGDAAGDGRR